MEGKSFEQELTPEEEYLRFVNDLPITAEEKERLKSVLTIQTVTRVVITQYNHHRKELILDPSQSKETIIEMIKNAFDMLYAIAKPADKTGELAVYVEEGVFENKEYQITKEDYFLQINALEIPLQDKELLKLLIEGNTSGKLTLAQSETAKKEILILPNQTVLEIMENISYALEELHTLSKNMNQPEELSVSFEAINIH